MKDPESQATEVPSTTTAEPIQEAAERSSRALAVQPVFCPEEVADPFDTVQW